MVLQGVTFPDDAIADFCRRHSVRRLSLFGSILTDDFHPESDVDVLIEFEPQVRMGLFKFAGLALELEKMIGRIVDLRTPQDLSMYFVGEVMQQARVLHAA